MTRLYVAGPMRGQPDHGYPAFRKAAADLRAAGYEVVAPHELDTDLPGFDPHDDATLTREHWHTAMTRDIEIVLGVDGVATLPYWRRSEGARIEVLIADVVRGIPVYPVTRWLRLARDGHHLSPATETLSASPNRK